MNEQDKEIMEEILEELEEESAEREAELNGESDEQENELVVENVNDKVRLKVRPKQGKGKKEKKNALQDKVDSLSAEIEALKAAWLTWTISRTVFKNLI